MDDLAIVDCFEVADAAYIAAADPATVTALLDALDEAERAVADVQLAQAVAAVTPCSCSAQRARADRAEAAVQRVRAQAQRWIDEYSDPVYRDNGWYQGVVSAATEVIRTLDGDA